MKLGIESAIFIALGVFVVVAFVVSSYQPDLQSDAVLGDFGTAPELTGTGRWINSEPLSLSELRGRVVLIDFWTYSCINCIRTIPYLNEWHTKYADDGLVIIGVHTPEFEFEKNYDNVNAAVARYGIEYPVVQDNEYATWRAYKNNFWPRKYIVDKEGVIRYDHIGEGGYEETEHVIQTLLGIDGTVTSGALPDFSKIGTPELYLGYGYARAPLGNPEGFVADSTITYASRNVTTENTVYLSGTWYNGKDSIRSVNNSRLSLIYTARYVNIVAGGSGNIVATVDGSVSTIAISGSALYTIHEGKEYDTLLLDIAFTPGIELYTFTFG